MEKSAKNILIAVFLTSVYFSGAFFMGLFNDAGFPVLTAYAAIPTLVALAVAFMKK